MVDLEGLGLHLLNEFDVVHSRVQGQDLPHTQDQEFKCRQIRLDTFLQQKLQGVEIMMKKVTFHDDIPQILDLRESSSKSLE